MLVPLLLVVHPLSTSGMSELIPLGNLATAYYRSWISGRAIARFWLLFFLAEIFQLSLIKCRSGETEVG